MSLFALVDMLKNNRMYFHPLHMFEDQWEGVPLLREETALRNFALRNNLEPEHYLHQLRLGRDINCVSCWHQSEDESIAMWKIYSGTGQGCCFVADMEEMINLFTSQRNIQHFSIKYVNRIEHFELVTPLPPIFHSAQFKDSAYSYENEYRFLICTCPALREPICLESIADRVDRECKKALEGQYIDFDASSVSGQILISPFLKQFEQKIMFDLLSPYCKGAMQINVSRLAIK